jgi:hypothetical protein
MLTSFLQPFIDRQMAWECRKLGTHDKVVISGCKIQVTIGATISHDVFLSEGLDNGSNCEAGTISFPNGKTLGDQAAQGLCEMTFREEFAKMISSQAA